MFERTDASDSGPVVEVEFFVRSSRYPFCRGSAEAACTFELAEMIPRPGATYAEFFYVTGADPTRIVALVDDYDSVDITVLAEYEHGGLFEFLVSGSCPAYRLAELGGLPQKVQGNDGEGRIVADIPPQYDPSAIIEAFLADTPAAELVVKREKETVTPLVSITELQHVLQMHLTDRQFEVVRTALEAGYYEWPREVTGQEIATELGIASATFSEHIHAAERKLLTALFDGSGATQLDAR
jgi:predicted DNA binding protein